MSDVSVVEVLRTIIYGHCLLAPGSLLGRIRVTDFLGQMVVVLHEGKALEVRYLNLSSIFHSLCRPLLDHKLSSCSMTDPDRQWMIQFLGNRSFTV